VTSAGSLLRFEGETASRLVGKEDRLDRFAEQARQAEGERQAGVVLARLDRIDGLARDVQTLGQLALRPAEAFTQFAHAAVHGAYRNLRATTALSRPYVPHSSGKTQIMATPEGMSMTLASCRKPPAMYASETSAVARLTASSSIRRCSSSASRM